MRLQSKLSSRRRTTTSSPRPSPRSKWRIRETPGQGCWNTLRIVEYLVTWPMMKWLFWSVSSVWHPVCFLAIWNRCSNKTKTFHRVLRYKILTNFWSHLTASDPPLWTRRRPWGRGCRYQVQTRYKGVYQTKSERPQIHISKRLMHVQSYCYANLTLSFSDALVIQTSLSPASAGDWSEERDDRHFKIT